MRCYNSKVHWKIVALSITLLMVSFIIWEIWKVRCSFIFENKPLDPIRTITAAQDFKSATNNYPQHDSHISPPCNFIGNNLSPITDHAKISFDGAWLAVSCSAGLGVIRKTADGHFGGGLAEKKKVCSALRAEAEAALLGISMARDLRDRKVIFESDSQILINSIKGNMGSGAWTILPLIREIRRPSSLFDTVEWRWIPRNQNQAAHMAAKIGLQTVGVIHWTDCPPPSIVRVLTSDGLPGPPM